MHITQTVQVPASRRLTIDVPREVPLGVVVITYETPDECPLCAESHTPNAETAAAIEEGRAMMRGEIPAKRFHSFNEMWKDLTNDDPDD